MSNKIKLVKNIISEISGVAPDEITIKAHFGKDLNIGEMELLEILTELEDRLEIDLVTEKDDIETIQNLLDLIIERVE